VAKEIEGLGSESSYAVGAQLYHLLYGRDAVGMSRRGKRQEQREVKNQRREIRHPDGRVEFIDQTVINEVIYEEWEN
jgi:hypothetical protein